MNIPKLDYTNNRNSLHTFKGLHVTNPKVQGLLLKSLNSKQLETLSNLVKNQENNSVHILLSSKNGKRLNASLFCPYRIKNFKTEYKQLFVVESKMHFIERMVKVANKYKKQIENFKVFKLNWDYPLLSAWKDKMHI